MSTAYTESIDQLANTGWVLIEGFSAPDELRVLQKAAYEHFPTLEAYEADPTAHHSLQGDQFAGMIMFPFAQTPLTDFSLSSAVVALVEQIYGSADLRLLRAAIQAKYAGAADYDQPLHFDYPNHTLVVPGGDRAYAPLGFFLYLEDITEELGPTHLVAREHAPSTDQVETHFFPDLEPTLDQAILGWAPELYDREVAAVGPAGSLLVYWTDTLHRGTAMTAAAGLRLTLSWAYGRAWSWQGFQCWPRLGEDQHLKALVARATPQQRTLLGFPTVDDPYWTAENLAAVGARYPGMDLAPYRSS
ncbi:MAG: hypothetical protein GKR89_06590 [Candidatus Latescibacteria bacterium]|nr:hypothetical protein [Candidatus Latescibacterota bacterium]